MKPILTVGMATFDDFHGVCFTLQAIRMFHRDALPYISFIVVDNNSQSRHGHMTREFCENVGAKYIDMPEPKGTSQPRNRVFEESDGLATLCMDPHVFIQTGALKRLVDYYRSNPDSKDLIQGPLWYDDLVNVSTHFSDKWNSEMYGTWDTDPAIFRENKQTAYEWRWNKQESKIVRVETPYADINIRNEPLRVSGQGLGLFSCITENWLGFNKSFRGFGGEEMYIHEKYQQAGAQCLILPWLLWWHRFGRPDGVPYQLNSWNKVRNYVLGHVENGLDLEPIRRHFVDGLNWDGTPSRPDGKGSVPPHEWESLVEDPERLLPKDILAAQEQRMSEGGQCDVCGDDAPATPIEELFRRAKETNSDLNEHVEKLKELASQADRVVDFSMRHGVSTVGLAAGLPKSLVTIAPNQPQEVFTLKKSLADKVDFQFVAGNSTSIDIPECDLLFIDTKHTADAFYQELSKHSPKVSRWIVRHDTNIYGERGEDGGPGLMAGLRRFLQENPEWSVVYHVPNNYGLVVISRDERDKPKLPSYIKMATNFTKALAQHVASGSKQASTEKMEKRLAACSICPHRKDDQCSICGCYVAEKAKWNEQECPIGKWKEMERTNVEVGTEELETI